MFIPKKKFDEHSIPKLVKGIVVPRPIAWISSVDEAGNRNLAPFSFFTVVSIQPPMLGVTIGKHPDRPKDTLANIEATGEYVINIANAELAGPMHKSGTVFPAEVDEFEATGLTAIDSEFVKAPRLKESPVSMEMKLNKIIPTGSHNFVIGEIRAFHISDKVYETGDYINATSLDAVARMAADYTNVRDFFFPDVD